MPAELEDVTRSVKDRVESQLAGTYAIQYTGHDFSSEGRGEWVRVDLLGPVPEFAPWDVQRERWIVQFQVFVRFDDATDLDRMYEIAQDVRDAFDRTDLSVLDWSAADPKPTLGFLLFDRPTSTNVPGPPEPVTSQRLHGLNLSYETHFID